MSKHKITIVERIREEFNMSSCLDVLAILSSEIEKKYTESDFRTDDNFNVIDWDIITSLTWDNIYYLDKTELKVKSIEDYNGNNLVAWVFQDNVPLALYNAYISLVQVSLLYRRYNLVSSYSELNISESFRELDESSISLIENRARKDLKTLGGYVAVEGIEGEVIKSLNYLIG